MKSNLYLLEGVIGEVTGSVGLVVDASCIDFQGSKERDGYFNGRVEWQGIDLETGERVFGSPVHRRSTINAGEFLAIVDGLRWLNERGMTTPVWSDSQIAIGWVLSRKAKTKLPENSETAEVLYYLRSALKWLNDNDPQNPVLWWDKKEHGENPADFGRK